MEPEPAPADAKEPKSNAVQAGGLGAVYGLGFLGALVYFIQSATSFWDGAFGVLKAFLWPAFLVYELLRFVAA